MADKPHGPVSERFMTHYYGAKRGKVGSPSMYEARVAWVKDLAKAGLPYPGSRGLDGFAAGWDEGFAACAGWRVVPTEPNDVMLHTFFAHLTAARQRGATQRDAENEAYRAMIAVSPEQPSPSGDVHRVSDIAFERYEAEYERVLYMEKATEMFGSEHKRMARRAMIDLVIAECSAPSSTERIYTKEDAERLCEIAVAAARSAPSATRTPDGLDAYNARDAARYRFLHHVMRMHERQVGGLVRRWYWDAPDASKAFFEEAIDDAMRASGHALPEEERKIEEPKS